MTILTLFGSIGLLLYGMKLMSESLQKLAGDRLRSVLASMNRNRLAGMLSGFLVTAMVQSSSATTVMIVSFVNAGLVSLAEAMAVIMGANVGSAVTTWLVASVGFEFDIALWLLPLIAIALPLFNSFHSTRSTWGQFIVGFALLFMGIVAIREAIPDLQEAYPSILTVLDMCCSGSFGLVLLFFLAGGLLTLLLQTSVASFVLTLALCSVGWIPFELGCAMVLGSNVGSCLAPVLATRSANPMARRVAMGHVLFNVIGLIWALALFYPFCHLINILCLGLNLDSPYTPMGAASGLAMYHTVFNVINLCLLLPLSNQIIRLTDRLIPDQENSTKAFHLQYLNKGLITSGELSLLQVKKETIRYAQEVYHMFELIRLMLNEKLGSEKQIEAYQQIRDMEEQSDDAEVEIAQFLNEISRKGLSANGEQMCRALYKMVDELESIADSLYHMAATLRSKSEQRVFFSATNNANVLKMMTLTDASLSHMLRVIENEEVSPNALNKAYNNEDEINNFRSQIRNEVLDPMDRAKLEYQQNTYYMELINECERIGDFVINVLAAQSQY